MEVAVQENIGMRTDNPPENKISIYLNYALVCFAFVLPLSRSGISILIAVIFLLWIAEGNWKSKRQALKKDRIFLAICAYVGFVLLSLLWTAHYKKAIPAMKNYGHLLLIPIILTSMKSRYFIPAIRAFAIGMLILIFLCVINFFGVLQISSKDDPRAANVFMHHLDFSMFLAWTIIFGILYLRNYTLFFKGKLFEKYSILWAVLVCISLVWIFVQDGRSGQLALILSLQALIFMLFWKNKKGFLLGGIIIFVILIFGQYEMNKKFRDKVIETQQQIQNMQRFDRYDSSLGYRIIGWNFAVKMISDSPLAGYGIGDSMDVFDKYIRWNGMKARIQDMTIITANHIHNQYLQILMETGFIGLGLFLSIFYFFYNGSRDKKMAMLLIIIFFSGFMVEPFMRNQFTSALISFFMAWIYSPISKNRDGNGEGAEPFNAKISSR